MPPHTGWDLPAGLREDLADSLAGFGGFLEAEGFLPGGALPGGAFTAGAFPLADLLPAAVFFGGVLLPDLPFLLEGESLVVAIV
jgi:hypothetical protein